MDYVEYLRSILPTEPRALIVDDSTPTRHIVRSTLESFGFEVSEAKNGADALAKLEDNIKQYDIILSDISMPKMDGFELCYRVNQATWYDNTPFVLVSTHSDARNVMQGLKLGADDFLPKPFDDQAIAQVVGRVIAVSA